MSKDITTYFTHFAAYLQKAYHESFVTRNCIPWWNINFARSYVIQYSKRNSKEEFDLLQHTKQIPFFEFFVCQYGIKKYLENNQQQDSFYPHLWHYDDCYADFHCPFRRRCDYFKLLQSVDKSLSKNEKLINMNSRGSLMRIKKQFHNLRPDYEIFLWIKSFDCTGTTQYKNESQLLHEFKQLALKRKKKQKSVQNTKKQHKNNNDTEIELQKMITMRQQILDELYTLKSPEYHPQSLSIHIITKQKIVITDLNQTNQNYNYPNYYESNSEVYIFADEEPANRHNKYIPINKFLYDNNINPQQFYLKFNEIDSINMVHEYEYPLNNGRCWNCNESFHHRCCAACKQILINCDCKFICGLTSPTHQKNKKRQTQSI
uniref:Uncharacterized protein n=1 Tax=Gigaspora margarita TaxID=4874 RepID=A0A8H3ZZG4_GIGMA